MTTIRGVEVEPGLPQPEFQGILVHEWTHIWILRNRIRRADRWQDEGMCELVAAFYLEDLDTARSRTFVERIERNPDPVYGVGFRRLRSLAQPTGLPQFLREVIAHRALPPVPSTAGRPPGLEV